MTDTKTPKTRTPRNLESIKAGAMSLDLKDRVSLCKDLKNSIDEEVKLLQTQASEAANVANTLSGSATR